MSLAIINILSYSLVIVNAKFHVQSDNLLFDL